MSDNLVHVKKIVKKTVKKNRLYRCGALYCSCTFDPRGQGEITKLR